MLKFLPAGNLPASYRSSHPEVFCEKSILKCFSKFTEKYLCQRPFFAKFAGLSLNRFEKFLGTPFYSTPPVAENYPVSIQLLLSITQSITFGQVQVALVEFKKCFKVHEFTTSDY